MHDDRSLDPLHDEELSALYALTRDPAHSPAPSLEAEARILAAAREPAPAVERRGPHYLRWASAAVVVLAVGVVLRGMQDGTPASGTVLRDAAAPQSMPAAPPASAIAEMTERKRSVMNHAPPAHPQPSIATGVMLDTPSGIVESQRPAKTEAVESDAVESESVGAGEAGIDSAPTVSLKKMAPTLMKDEDPRLALIREMQAEGRTEEARAALKALIAERPDIALDPELRALLP